MVTRLTLVAAKGGEEGGNPPPISVPPRLTVRDWGGDPKHGNVGPHRKYNSTSWKGAPAPAARETRAQAGGGGGSSRPHTSTARILRTEEGEDPPERQCSLPAHGMQAREGRETPNQEEEDGAPPKQRELLAHGMQERGGGGTRT